MFRILSALILMITTCSTVRAADTVLLWLFEDPVISDFANPGASLHAADLVGRGGEAEGKKANAIRVSATDSSGDKVYLNLGDAVTKTMFGDYAIIPDAGDPEEGILPSYSAGPGFADMAGLGLSDTGLKFAIEIGYAEFNDDKEVSKWVILAAGEDTYENLKRFTIGAEESYQGTVPWSGGTYNVPEPSSGLLVLVGGALLALRRRRKNARV